MREVPRPVLRPFHCAVLPHVGQTAEGQRWVDTNAELTGWDNHVYLSEQGLRQAAAALKLMFVDDEDYLVEVRRADDAEAERDELQWRVDELESYKAATRLVLEQSVP